MIAAVYIVPILIFCTVLLLVLAISRYVSYLKGRRELLRKLERDGQKKVGHSVSLKELAQQILLKITHSLGRLAKPKQEKEISHLRKRFMQAGLSKFKNIMLVFFGSKVLCMMALPLLVAVFRFAIFKNMLPIQLLFMMVVLALVGFYVPDLWLRIRINNRKEQIVRGFPDGLDLMVICAEAGMGLDAIINRVGEEMKFRHPILSEELKTLTLELRAGKLRRDALRSFAMRTDSEDIQSFATLLIQTERFGTNIAQAMRVQSDSMRTKRAQRVEELAAKLPVKLLFPTIFFIFPSLFLVLMGPALIRAFRVWQAA